MLKPLRGYVLVEEIDESDVRASGLVMPETAKDKSIKGTVLRIGEPTLEQQDKLDAGGIVDFPDINLGDKVVFKKWATNDLEEDGKKLAFVRFEDILGAYE